MMLNVMCSAKEHEDSSEQAASYKHILLRPTWHHPRRKELGRDTAYALSPACSIQVAGHGYGSEQSLQLGCRDMITVVDLLR